MIKKTVNERIEQLRHLTGIARSDGTWNFDSYMHGMANGMILAMAVIDDEPDPDFFDRPDEWLSDKIVFDAPTEGAPAKVISISKKDSCL